MSKRSERLDRIRTLIRQQNVRTQKDLAARLQAEGFACTEATVSRDTQDLRLQKRTNKQGESIYVLEEDVLLQERLQSFVQAIEPAENLIVMRCEVGAAQSVAAALDKVALEGVLGTIAGDDTILLVCKHKEEALKVTDYLKRFCN